MSRSGLPSALSLVLTGSHYPDNHHRVMGSDAVVLIDGRWSRETAMNHVYSHVSRLSTFKGEEFTVNGYMPLGNSDYSGRVYRF